MESMKEKKSLLVKVQLKCQGSRVLKGPMRTSDWSIYRMFLASANSEIIKLESGLGDKSITLEAVEDFTDVFFPMYIRMHAGMYVCIYWVGAESFINCKSSKRRRFHCVWFMRRQQLPSGQKQSMSECLAPGNLTTQHQPCITWALAEMLVAAWLVLILLGMTAFQSTHTGEAKSDAEEW